MNSKPFHGTNVFMSRKLVPPELFDALQDALKQNGAEVFLCCDPSRSGPTDYHVISSPEHEKFEDLRSQGCQLIGPHCVLSCAKERRALPTQGFTCCLAMDGVKILMSGFEANEKEKIVKLVTAMRGSIHMKASSDVNFVVAKNVLAMKYKWALNISKKPIVSINWIDQCWKEHRVVPQEPYKILPFSGLMICVTGISSGERKSMEQLILQNGGKYSAELTKNAPEGDKYKVARRWGHIYIVTRKWFDQSIARCLRMLVIPHENISFVTNRNFLLMGATVSSINAARSSFSSQRSQDTTTKTSQSAFSSAVADSNQQVFPNPDVKDQDLDTTISQKGSFKAPDYSDVLKEDKGMPSEQPISEFQVDGCVADDSQSEDNDLYLSECRIFFVGFGAPELRKLVNAVRKGGGSRYMSINDKLTHVVIGDPSELEKKEIRSLTASGVIKVMRANWLEDCDRLKKEIPVLQKHTGHDILLPRGSLAGNDALRQLNSFKTSSIPANAEQDHSRLSFVASSETGKRGSSETIRSFHNPIKTNITVENHSHVSFANEHDTGIQKVSLDACNQSQLTRSISTIFKGKRFHFSCSFPEERVRFIFLRVLYSKRAYGLHRCDLVVRRSGVGFLTSAP
uniref:BRCT domain-containing protein n=1 Tax=Kalanchoe fedtschenkoi TaxID=63787 RepID=A0A7N1A2N6_KALFE